ncbi:YncE family protein [Wenyingzhuangia sp. IMCC45533]
MNVTKLISKLFLLSLVFVSCEDEIIKEIEKEVEVEKIVEVEVGKDQEFKNAFLISAEGNFGSRDGSLSFVANDFKMTSNFIYNQINKQILGGLIQSITFGEENAYIILNDVNTIVVVDRITLKKKDIITTGLGNPRYMTIIGNRAYVTNWGDGSDKTDDYVAVIDLNSNTTLVDEKIDLDNGVEQILNKDNKLYVSHKGAFSTNNIISVVDLNDKSVSEIMVKDNPDEMVFSDNGDLIVLSEGNPTEFAGPPFFEVLKRSQSAIQTIDINTNTIKNEVLFDENEGADLMVYENGEIFYHENGEVFTILENSTTLGTDSISTGNLYGMNVFDGKLFAVSFAFKSLSKLSIYDIETKNVQFETAVGLGASKIYFTR